MAQDSSVMLALGDYRFSVATAAYQALERTSQYRWATHNTFGTQPQHQFVGPGRESLILKGVIYPHYKGGLGQVDAMRQLAGRGTPLKLRASTGKTLGQWVITAVREVQSELLSGQPLKQEFSLSLLFYGTKG